MELSGSTLSLILMPFFSYLLGSMPFGLIVSKLRAGIDVREHGSGNIGMANVLRTTGIGPAIIVLLLDSCKAIIPIVLAGIITDSPTVKVVSGLAALSGHIWPVFIRFRGGRAAATGLGALLAFSPICGLVSILLAAITIGITRYISLGSIVGTTAGTLCMIFMSLIGSDPTVNIWFAVIAGPLIIIRHRDNISRLVKGNELQIGKSTVSTQSARKNKGFRWPKLV